MESVSVEKKMTHVPFFNKDDLHTLFYSGHSGESYLCKFSDCGGH